RVDGEVHDDLFDHPLVRLDDGQVGGTPALQFDVLANDAFEHFVRVADDFIQIERTSLHLLLATEGKQLARQVGGPLAGRIDLLQIVFRLPIEVLLIQDQVGVPHDNREDVVEIVRHAASQLAERLHFLRLPELLFDLLPLDELANLNPDGGEHLQQVLVRRTNLRAEKLDDAKDFTP